jgi:molecular chaperone GrpE
LNAGEERATAKDELTTLKEELAAERDKYLRLAAEYDNFRKRNLKERETVYGDARADTITRLLPVYDNLERALRMECADEAFYKGVEMTMTQLTEILGGMGVTKINAVGEPFDPTRHNAITTIENAALGEKIIAEECQKGFMLGGKVIRFASVVVAN